MQIFIYLFFLHNIFYKINDIKQLNDSYFFNLIKRHIFLLSSRLIIFYITHLGLFYQKAFSFHLKP
jgi:hypothetical protein